MNPARTRLPLVGRFETLYGCAPDVTASAPGRLEVLGNHTDYNAGLTLSCAVAMRCYAAVSAIDEPVARLASTAFDQGPEAFPLDPPAAPRGHWANYVLGLVSAMRQRGLSVPGFALLVDSDVPRSAGVSSSAALEMAVLTALVDLMGVQLPAVELARIGQAAESGAVGAQTGLLDQLTSLLGQRDHLLRIDFRDLAHSEIALQTGYCFVAIDSGVKHDLTKQYNDLRVACEQAASAMGVETLRSATVQQLAASQPLMNEHAWACARHVISENARVQQAVEAVERGDMKTLGALMSASHESSRDDLRNSCYELDQIVELARKDTRCLGARLSGGGFGGITIHLVRRDDALGYKSDMLDRLSSAGQPGRWAEVCEIDDGVAVHR